MDNENPAERTSTSDKRQNFGEEIPGSRRDQAQRTSRALDELAAMDDAASQLSSSQIQAKLTEIRRDDIWGSLDERLAQLQSQGASPSLALAWRVLYRGVAASAASMDLKPTHGRYHTLTPHEGYIFGLCYEATLKGIAADMESFPLDATWPEINDIGFSQVGNRSYRDGPMVIDQIETYLGANDYLSPQDGAAAWLRSAPANRGTKHLISLVRKQRISANDPLTKARTEVFDEYAPGWRDSVSAVMVEFGAADILAASYLRSLLISAITGDYPYAIDLREADRAAVESHFGTLDLAADEVYSRISATPGFDPWTTIKPKKVSRSEDNDSLSFESILRPKIMPATRFENLKRETKSSAPSRRSGNVTEDDLYRLVPFRGIQYGNWATQSERQEMLNLAYDAMSDLALALEVSPQYLALPIEGTSGPQSLGLALGARGRGGNAAAHYEPAAHVINLTKTKGGGALAHEWMHAYDHKVASELPARASLASEMPGNPVSDFVRVLSRQDRRMSNAEALEVATARKLDLLLEALLPPAVEKELAAASGSPETWQSFGAAMLETISDWATDPRPVVTYACAGRYVKVETARRNMESGLVQHGVPTPAAAALATLWSEKTYDSTWIKLDRRIRREVASRSGQTAYLTQAQILNGNKATGYWSAPTELFARAGSAVVFDRLREIHGIANGFLDASSAPECFDPAMHRANPNPAGSERERFRSAFTETLLKAMQQEDADAPYRQRAGTQLRMRF